MKRYKIEPGLFTHVEYVRAVDGDTIEFEIKRKFKIRLRNIDTPELNTNEGKEAKDFVDKILSNADKNNIIIFIPSNDPEKLMDITSFERIIGDVFVNGKNLVDFLIRAGYTSNKE